jgi:hypothetical protein
MIGEQYGDWKIVGEPFLKQLKKQKQSYVLCRCKCGTEKFQPVISLKKGRTTQCRSCATHNQMTKHGKHSTPEYKIWSGIRQRCLNPKHRLYSYYGERGIKIDPKWEASFEQFLRDMGPRPSAQYTIDRIDNNGHYNKENCAWRTRKQQARNRRDNLLLTHNGKTQTMVEWAEELGINSNTLHARINQYGWSAERALSEPVHTENRRKT